MRLIEAWEMAENHGDVFWDFGPGERPQVIEQQLKTVARKESIPVIVQRGRDSLKLIFQAESQQQAFRVVSKDGDLKSAGKVGEDPRSVRD